MRRYIQIWWLWGRYWKNDISVGIVRSDQNEEKEKVNEWPTISWFLSSFSPLSLYNIRSNGISQKNTQKTEKRMESRFHFVDGLLLLALVHRIPLYIHPGSSICSPFHFPLQSSASVSALSLSLSSRSKIPRQVTSSHVLPTLFLSIFFFSFLIHLLVCTWAWAWN